MDPSMYQIKQHYDDRLVVGKLEMIDGDTDLIMLDVKYPPTLILCVRGEEAARHEDLLTYEQIQAMAESHL